MKYQVVVVFLLLVELGRDLRDLKDPKMMPYFDCERQIWPVLKRHNLLTLCRCTQMETFVSLR